MSDSVNTPPQRPNVARLLVEHGQKAFDPSLDPEARAAGLEAFNKLIQRSDTWPLLAPLNTLIKPGALPPWLAEPFMQTLTMLPLKSDGVRGTLEFIFQVHPSNDGKIEPSAKPQKQEASITHEAVAHATRLLSSVPKSITPQAWFEGISGQLFHLMDGNEGDDLARVAAQVVGFGVLGKRLYGEPGAPGWNIFAQPFLEDINPSLLSQTKDSDAELVDLSRGRVIVTAEQLRKSFQRVKLLVLTNSSAGLCKRLLQPIIAQIWSIAALPHASSDGALQTAAQSLLQTYLKLFGTADSILHLFPTAPSNGSLSQDAEAWFYRASDEGAVDIVAGQPEANTEAEVDWQFLQQKAAILAEKMLAATSKEDTSTVFLGLLRRWIAKAEKSSGEIVLQAEKEDEPTEPPQQDLFEISLLQQLLDKAPGKLVSQFDQVVSLICEVLQTDSQASLGDELVGVVLSLLNMVITAPTFQRSDIQGEEIASIETSLERLAKSDRSVAQTASNLAMLLRYRDQLDQEKETASTAPGPRQVEDRRKYNLAMNYITEIDSPPPVVSEGLNLLSELIQHRSSVLDINTTTLLLCRLLANGEDFVNLRIVKMLNTLADKHPKTTIKEILENYLDPREKSTTDTRLRFGEALLQIVQRLGQTFAGDLAQQIAETLLSIAGRRGYRAKTKAKQARDERLQALKAKKGKAKEEEDLLSDDEEELSEEQKANNDILTRILQGWESKRGTEDVRMRTSALSIFGTALETNIGGIGPALASGGVDLSLHVLVMEPEMEKGILRRAAIIAILSFVRALAKAREEKRSLGFGLTDASREDITRTLQYVAGTDNDALVQQHAQDVIESLEAWQMTSLLPRQDEDSMSGPVLGRLAGLAVNPVTGIHDPSEQSRPRIEEIE
ncbi:uncharacterized protein F5Z01DRAFT_679662 [Emericellopsis atlantica]|uniref:Protein required for cell viability n=1 Tax=Emericellopsis atlantica TaxID=2614577 RepID=A0A9P7ZSU6_9HYPO|nr:uncharacterized protein F5Z01DRAFT_679662 [Emericellopsis atlantica]KAG9257719.1 hypothetical protein F5Z01DRAFT_679662 [Emericellopsis atlantica]